MLTNSRRFDSSAVAGAAPTPAVTITLAQDREVERVKRFPIRLKAYLQWMKRFLHGGR